MLHFENDSKIKEQISNHIDSSVYSYKILNDLSASTTAIKMRVFFYISTAVIVAFNDAPLQTTMSARLFYVLYRRTTK